MRDTILILTNTEDDPHTVPVIEKLQLADQKVFRFDSDTMVSGKAKLNILSTKRGIQFSLSSNHGTVNSSQIKGVWYRRPNFFNLKVTDVVQRQQAEAEISACLEGMWMVLDDRFWISTPHLIERARKKVYQLALAHKIGFILPKTLITNDSAEFRSFYAACGGEVIYKTLTQPYFDYSEKGFVIPTT